VVALGIAALIAHGAAADGRVQPRIFNGIVTFDYPFAGLLLKQDRAGEAFLSRCSLSLVGPVTALTAAHCLCDAHGSLCQPGKRYAPQPERFRVLLQNAGVLEIASVAIPADFDFPNRDFAAIVLREPVPGIAPVPLAGTLPAFGTAGEIVGFGSTSADGTPTGIKRVGPVVTASCEDELDDDRFVCWTSDGGPGGANTCPGDSGAPLLVAGDGRNPVLAGLASGGYGACDGEDLAFDTAVAPIRGAVAAIAGGPLAQTDSGGRIRRAAVASGRLDAATPALILTIEVPEGTARLIVVGNGEDTAGNDHVLRLRRGEPPGPADADCIADRPGVFEACELHDPEPGTWYAEYRRSAGLGGEVQLSASAFDADCTLDVDGDGRFDALTDGLLVLRHLSGRSGPALTDGALGADAWRTSPAEIAGHLESAACERDLDADANGVRDAQTDGQLVLRYLFGFRGAALSEGALGTGATRTTAEEIEGWIDGLMR
jgi:hypothetical protein